MNKEQTALDVSRDIELNKVMPQQAAQTLTKRQVSEIASALPLSNLWVDKSELDMPIIDAAGNVWVTDDVTAIVNAALAAATNVDAAVPADQGAQELPPLPEPEHDYITKPGFTANQMRGYALAALAAAPSQGAKEAEPFGWIVYDSLFQKAEPKLYLQHEKHFLPTLEKQQHKGIPIYRIQPIYAAPVVAQQEAAQPVANEREAFEAWYDKQFVNPGFAKRHRHGDGYCTHELDNRWKGWNAKAAAGATQPVAYVNRNELDNMLDDRTAVISGVRDGWRKTPLYAAPIGQDSRNAVLEAALTKLCDQLEGMRRTMFLRPGTGQHYSYLVHEDVHAYIEEARRALKNEAAQDSKEQGK